MVLDVNTTLNFNMILFIIFCGGLGLATGDLSHVPLVPASDDQDGRRWDDHHDRRYHDYNEDQNFKDDIRDYEKLSPPCKLLIERFKERILRDEAKVRVYGNSQNDYLRSAEVRIYHTKLSRKFFIIITLHVIRCQDSTRWL